MSLDKINHSRTIYGTLDLLGDIGGLGDAFSALGRLIVALSSLIMGSNLDKLLIKLIFKEDSCTIESITPRIVKKSNVHIKQRVPFSVRVCKLFTRNSVRSKLE